VKTPEPRGSWFSACSPLVIYSAYIFYKGTCRGVDAPFQLSDKILHAASFGLMVAFALRAVRYFWRGPGVPGQIVVSVAWSSAAGAALEFWQAFLPYRTADVLDWLADTAGAFAVGVALWVFLCWFGFEKNLGSSER
jgi:VanZ family protein